MPTINVDASSPRTDIAASHAVNVLPQILQTPSGLALLEIQGTVQSESDAAVNQDGTAGPLQLGKLTFPSNGKVYLTVGKHQRLTGEMKKLIKPVAVLRKRASMPDEHGTEDLEIAEIIYYKLLFTHRPEPMGESEQELT